MPTRITNFLHDSVVEPGSAPVLGTAFDLADIHSHDLTATLPTFQRNGRNYYGIVESVYLRLASIAGGATKITFRVTLDAAGDRIAVPDTEATIATGITTATEGCAVFKVAIPIFQTMSAPGNGNLYLFAQLDAGSASWVESVITWRE